MQADQSQPLWLPKGSVRAMLTMGALGMAGLLLIIGIQVPDWYVAIIMLVVRDYFAERAKPDAQSNQ